MKPVVYTKVPRIDRALIARAAKLSMADLHEGLGAIFGRQCLMSERMRPVYPGLKLCGQAITCFNFPGDNLMLHAAVRIAEEGDIIVATNGGNVHGALWGDMITFYSQIKKLGGAVVDGGVRDTETVQNMGFPVFSTAICAAHPEKRGPGAANVPVNVAGVLVEPGDLIVGDNDGILVIPPDHVETAVTNAETRAATEEGFREKLTAGSSMFDLLKLQDIFDAAGVEEIDATWKDRD